MRYIILSLFLTANVFAQPEIDFFRYYEGHGAVNDWFYDIYQSRNEGYYVVGTTTFTSGWVLRVDGEGEPGWSVFQPWRNCRTAIECDNGDILVGGSIGGNFGAIRYTAEGEEVFRSEFQNGTCQAVIELKNGDFALCGASAQRGAIIRISQEGETVWETYLGNDNETEYFMTMRETEGGIVTAGRFAMDGWIVKVNFEGGVLWNKRHHPQNAIQWGYDSMISRPQGGFAIAGVNSLNNGPYVGKLTFVDSRGDITDGFNLTPENVAGRFTGIGKTPDGGMVLVGYYIDQADNGITYPFAVRLNRQNQVIWTSNFSEQVANAAARTGQTNLFNSVIVQRNGAIIGCGAIASNTEGAGQDGFITRLEPEELGPQIFYFIPEDTLFSLLIDSEIDFIVRARNREGIELEYQWSVNDSLLGNDTLFRHNFDQSGQFIVNCRLTDVDAVISLAWHITVTDLFIDSYSPDTLALFLRRGTSQTFSLDSVAAVEGDPVQYQWTLTNIDNFEREDAGMETGATVEFLQSGNYQLEGLAYRGESSDNVIWTIQVRSAILDFWPRSQNLSVLADSLVNFGVLPFNPASDSLSYRWEVDGDSVGSDSTVDLRFVWNGQAGRSTYAVAAIVMDGAEGDTVRWEVTVQDPNATPPTPPSIEGGEVPSTFGITSISPNPFNNTTTIRFTVPSASASSISAVNLTLHDLTGREVQQLVNSPLSAGQHSYTLNGADLPAGIYLLKLEVGNSRKVAKVALVR